MTQSVSPSSAGRSVNTLDADTAAHFARLALAHVAREYPNKLDHILLDDEDVQSPASLHPVFFGSFDWHSCVHGYWLMATVARKFEARRIGAHCGVFRYVLHRGAHGRGSRLCPSCGAWRV